MTSLESTGVARPARPEEARTPGSVEARSASRTDGESNAARALRGSPDPFVATDRYRLTQPYTRRI